MMKPTDKQIEAAAAWWMKAIENPKFDTLGATRNVPENRSARIAENLATVAAIAQKASQDFIQSFGAKLKKILAGVEFHSCLAFGTDYHPGGYLAEAANQTEMRWASMTTFPWKTTMWLYADGRVEVSCGYGAGREVILPADPALAATEASE